MQVTKEILDAFFLKFNAMPHNCVICGCNQFGVNDMESQVISLNRVNNNLQIDGEVNHIPTITTHCMNCGHIDQFAIQVFMNSPVK